MILGCGCGGITSVVSAEETTIFSTELGNKVPGYAAVLQFTLHEQRSSASKECRQLLTRELLRLPMFE
jgi:hypothetical protein